MNLEMDALLDRITQEISTVLQREEFADLLHKRWDDLEEPAVNIGDRITQKVLALLLAKQAEEIQKHAPSTCRQCGTQLDEPAFQARTLVTRRGKVHWKTPVHYCDDCRRDFFPSAQNARD